MAKHTKRAFTLSEVLITMAIIGVIAAITIPALIQATERNEFVSSLKKTAYFLTNSLNKIAIDNGSPVGDYSFVTELGTDYIDELVKVANVVKKCNNQKECFGEKLLNAVNYKRLNGTPTKTAEGKAVILNDGQIITYVPWGTYEDAYVHDIDGHSLGYFTVDLNGKRKPNTLGRDLFIFYILQDKGIVPGGYGKPSACKKNSTGGDCAARVLQEGKMNY